MALRGRRETTSGPGTKNFTGPCHNIGLQIAGNGVLSIIEKVAGGEGERETMLNV